MESTGTEVSTGLTGEDLSKVSSRIKVIILSRAKYTEPIKGASDM